MRQQRTLHFTERLWDQQLVYDASEIEYQVRREVSVKERRWLYFEDCLKSRIMYMCIKTFWILEHKHVTWILGDLGVCYTLQMKHTSVWCQWHALMMKTAWEISTDFHSLQWPKRWITFFFLKKKQMHFTCLCSKHTIGASGTCTHCALYTCTLYIYMYVIHSVCPSERLSRSIFSPTRSWLSLFLLSFSFLYYTCSALYPLAIWRSINPVLIIVVCTVDACTSIVLSYMYMY